MPPPSPPAAFTALSAALKRALGPAGADGRLADEATAAARRLAGVGAVRGPPAVGGDPGAAPSTAGPPLSPAAAAALAQDWAGLVDAVREHQDLLTSYDIGIDREARQLEDVRRTAARVGLRLPPPEEAG